MSEHAFLPPSAAARWVVCPLSASLEARYPETEPSEASIEGTAAHWVVEQILHGIPAVLDTLTPTGIAVTQEMIDAAVMVQEIIDEGPHGTLWIEKRVDIPRVHASLNWGTPDYVNWSPGRLTIYDFKFGHKIIEVRENWQLIDYAAGLIKGEYEESLEVEFVIIQPRAYHRDGPVRRWIIRGVDLRGHINILRNAAEDATSDAPSALPTPEGCENCKGRHACEALQRAAYAAMEKAKGYLALDLDSRSLGIELQAMTRAQALLNARVSGLEAQAVAKIKAGDLVHFWSLESSPGRLAWTKPVAEVLELGHLLGLELKKPDEAVTPTQAKALAKSAKIPEAIFEPYAARPAGSVKLVYDDGSRVSIIFSN